MSLYFVGFGQTKLQLFFCINFFSVKCSKNILPIKAFTVDHCSSHFQLYWKSIWKYTMGRNSDTALRAFDDLIGLPTNPPNFLNIELIQRIMGGGGMMSCNHNLSCVQLHHGISFCLRLVNDYTQRYMSPFWWDINQSKQSSNSHTSI